MQKARNKALNWNKALKKASKKALKKEENSEKALFSTMTSLINDLGEFGKQGSYISASVDQEQGNITPSEKGTKRY
ncbi:unnamed protein product [Camellia sinensis]